MSSSAFDRNDALRVWIDIENPPQVQYLLPFHSAFQRANAEVFVTARNYGFALDLLTQSGVQCREVGASLAKSTWQKAWGTVKRSNELAALFSEEQRPHAVLGAGRASALTARRLGFPSFVILDYEHAHVAVYRLTGTYILYPSVVDPAVLTRRGISRRQLMPFSGIKEDITFAGIDVDAIQPHVFPNVDGEARLVLFRPPAEESHYFDPESRRIALQALDYLSRLDDVVVVYSPRMSWQSSYLERSRWKRQPIVLTSPVPFLPLLKAVDAVVSSGGTMLREAAYLGIPAFSIFRSEIGAVDRHLEGLGRLTILESADDFDRLAVPAVGRQPLLQSNPDLLDGLAAALLARVGAPAAIGRRRRPARRPWVPARAPQKSPPDPGPTERPLFTSSRALLLLDYFRIPYSIRQPTAEGKGDRSRLARLSNPSAHGRELLWAPVESDSPRGARPAACYRLRGFPIFGRLVRDAEAAVVLETTGKRWAQAEHVVDEQGASVGSVWRAHDGSVFLPFDVDEIISAFWSEGFARLEPRLVSPASRLARDAYYALRPAIPRPLQIAFRRRFAHVQARAGFPHWPIETALHDLYAFLLTELDAVAGEPVPRIAPWPGEYKWSVVLTHDVETRIGYDNLDRILAVERAMGYRSAVYFVPERDYRVAESFIGKLAADGFEIGVHGLRHDGRDLSPLRFPKRLPEIRRYAKRWGASGFRSPSTHRDWGQMSLLDFDYDSSYSDTAVYEPQAGGCCTWLPFFIGEVLELPITLPQDHTLFVVLGQEDETGWVEKATFLRANAGMALLLTHPDYLGDNGTLAAYTRFLEWLRDDGETAWHALPREVSAWWRRRAASAIERDGDDWHVVGPAAGEARIETGPLG